MAGRFIMKAPGLDKLIKKLGNRERFIQSHDNQEIDLGKVKILSSGPFLHQYTDELSEEASAKFEADNKEVFAWLQSFGKEIKNKTNV